MKATTLKVYKNRRPIEERRITNGQVQNALKQYDEEHPLNDYPRTNQRPNIKTWLLHQKYDYAIKYNDKCYPPKYILELALDPKLEDGEYFYGGGKPGNANWVLQELGFEIIFKSAC